MLLLSHGARHLRVGPLTSVNAKFLVFIVTVSSRRSINATSRMVHICRHLLPIDVISLTICSLNTYLS